MMFGMAVCMAIILIQSFKVQNLREDLQIRNIDIKKKNKQLEIYKDSLRVVKQKNVELDSLWSGIVKDQLNALIQERNKVSNITKKYEIAKNTPPPKWTNAQLDSLLESIIR